MKSHHEFAICRESRLVLLCSSGLDSLLLTAVALDCNNEVWPLFISFGFPWEEDEYRALLYLHQRYAHSNLRPVTRVQVDGRALLGNTWAFSSTIIPQWENGILTNTIVGRNACLVALGHTFALVHKVENLTLGITSHSYTDAQKSFLDSLAGTLNEGMNGNVRLHYPMPTATTQMIRDFVAAHPDIPWESSLSCYRPALLQRCNDCYKCTEVDLHKQAWGISSGRQPAKEL